MGSHPRIAGLLRQLCMQTTLPLAAELGHDYAVGLKERLRSLYARGSVFVTLQARGRLRALAVWPNFFALWTHGAAPYDPWLADRHRSGRPVDSGADLCQLEQSRRSSGANQGATACSFPCPVGSAHPPDGAAGGGYLTRRERPCDPVRAIGRYHHQADPSAAGSARRLSGRGDVAGAARRLSGASSVRNSRSRQAAMSFHHFECSPG
jgi:hypothetical protein